MSVLSPTQIAQVAANAGFRGNALIISVAVALAESGGNTSAHNPGNGTTDIENSWGLWQINLLAHPQYSATAMQNAASNAAAAFTISSGGSNWGAWGTYTSGAYSRFMSTAQAAVQGVSSGGNPGGGVKVSTATSNTYPPGQCTWYACQKYHDLTGYYVPWKANANGWASGAKGSQGWNVSSTPVVPSIICLQAGVQLADPTYGHVGVVSSINANGTVTTTDLNWGLTQAQRSQVSTVTFTPGAGVSFIYAAGTGGSSSGSSGTGLTGSPTSYTSLLAGLISTSALPPMPTFTMITQQIHQTLINMPGFYGIALALDEAEQFPGWIDLTRPQMLDVAGVNTGITLPDIPGEIRSIGATIADNALPLLMRDGLILMGGILLMSLVLKASEPAIGAAMKVLPLIAG
jgi:surface antigen